jgi:hypothetical protein
MHGLRREENEINDSVTIHCLNCDISYIQTWELLSIVLCPDMDNELSGVSFFPYFKTRAVALSRPGGPTRAVRLDDNRQWDKLQGRLVGDYEKLIPVRPFTTTTTFLLHLSRSRNYDADRVLQNSVTM